MDPGFGSASKLNVSLTLFKTDYFQIQGLSSMTSYKFKIFSENGVSKVKNVRLISLGVYFEDWFSWGAVFEGWFSWDVDFKEWFSWGVDFEDWFSWDVDFEDWFS